MAVFQCIVARHISLLGVAVGIFNCRVVTDAEFRFVRRETVLFVCCSYRVFQVDVSARLFSESWIVSFIL